MAVIEQAITAALPAPTTSALRARNVGLVYRGKKEAVEALRDIDLDVLPGEFVTVVGRSGSGKSTLLRLLAGLLRPTTGVVDVDGGRVTAPPAQARFVAQDYTRSLLPWKTVVANVRFGVRHGVDVRKRDHKDAVNRALQLVGLDHARDRYPWELSGGMQQRVAIARAIASKPRILFMDEAFSSVDALSRAQLQDTLLTLWEELGLTVVFVTHDIDEAVYLSDRVVVLHENGRGVRSVFDVDLPRPRHQVTTKERPEYLALRRELLGAVLD